MKSRALIKNIKLPSAPGPTRAVYKKPVVGTWAPGMRVVELPCKYNPRPAAVQKFNPKATRCNKGRGSIYERAAWPEERLQKLMDLYESGLPIDDISAILKCSPNCIGTMLTNMRKAGRLKAHRIQTGWSLEQDEILMEMYSDGRTYREIGDAIGKGVTTVHTRVHRLIQDGALTEREDKRCKRQQG